MTYSDMQEIVIRRGDNGEPKVTIHQRDIIDRKAQFALGLIERLGICAGMPDGEDSNGQQKIRIMSPEEIVAKAFELADKSYEEIRIRGWVDCLPPWDEIMEKIQEVEAK